MQNVVSFLYYTARSCIFIDDLDSILYVPLLIVYCNSFDLHGFRVYFLSRHRFDLLLL